MEQNLGNDVWRNLPIDRGLQFKCGNLLKQLLPGRDQAEYIGRLVAAMPYDMRQSRQIAMNIFSSRVNLWA